MWSGKYRTAQIILDSYQAICFLAAAKAGQANQGWISCCDSLCSGRFEVD
jgi:hypothetical protein